MSTTASDKLLRDIADRLTDGVLALDQKGRAVYVNRAAQALTGREEKDLLGRELASIFALEHVHKRIHLVNIQIPRSGALTLRAGIQGTDYLVTISRIDTTPAVNSEHPGASALAVIRPERPAGRPDESAASTELLVMGHLTRSIAHDFNNSLTSILGNAELVEEILHTLSSREEEEAGEKGPATRALPIIRDVLRKSLEMAEFIKGLQEYTRRPPPEKQPTDVNRVIGEAMTIARGLAGRRIKTEFIPREGLPPVGLERSRIEQILFGLLVHSRERMPYGGRIRVETGLAEAGGALTETDPGSNPGPYVRLSVEDTGGGMDEGTIRTRFESPGDPGHGGAGPGLADVDRIVRQSEGYLQVKSLPGMGTRIDIYLPFARTEAHTAARQEEQPLEMTRPSEGRDPQQRGTITGRKPLILIAEDDEAVQLSMRRQLERAGYRVEITGTGDQAYTAFLCHSEQGDPVDLLIADLGVPGMDARALLLSVRHLDPTARVLLTSGDSPGEEEGYEFLPKPFETADLLQRIESILRAKDEV